MDTPMQGPSGKKHADERIKAAGFVPIAEEWPSCYFHYDLRLFLVVYVDDFKLSGPSENLQKGWKLLTTDTDQLSGIKMDPPERVGYNKDTGQRNGKTLYQGCYHSVFEKTC